MVRNNFLNTNSKYNLILSTIECNYNIDSYGAFTTVGTLIARHTTAKLLPVSRRQQRLACLYSFALSINI